MAKPTAFDEQFVHQIPELLTNVVTYHHHWRESLFFDIHDPNVTDASDVVFLTMAVFPARNRMDSIQMGRVDGNAVLGVRDREIGGDPHTLAVPGVSIEVVRPWQEVRLFADPDQCAIGIDATFVARTQPYALRRGTMRVGHELIWDQSHIFQSGTYQGTLTVDGRARSIDGWIGQRDHSWGIRDHGRCPLWIWFQIQLDDGFLGVWHWELSNGARIYTDGCWAPTDGSDPVPIVDFSYDLQWVGAGGAVAYSEHGDDVAGLQGECTFKLADGRRLVVSAEGTFARPYEPFHRGGLNLMRVRTDDGREGTAIYEVTGARHHHFFPDTVLEGTDRKSVV